MAKDDTVKLTSMLSENVFGSFLLCDFFLLPEEHSSLVLDFIYFMIDHRRCDTFLGVEDNG
ncbi:MAG TPA: hypothetical protein VK588_08650 [Chitinophagaceae bacterium]|nr:hypothetical protein [Chitinophagaceae bacterium]